MLPKYLSLWKTKTSFNKYESKAYIPGTEQRWKRSLILWRRDEGKTTDNTLSALPKTRYTPEEPMDSVRSTRRRPLAPPCVQWKQNLVTFRHLCTSDLLGDYIYNSISKKGMEGLYLHCNSHVLNYKPKYCWSNIPDHSERLTKSSSIKKLIVIIMKNKKQNKTNTRGYTMENQDRLGIIQMLHPNKHPSWTLREPQSEALHWCHISQDRLPGGKRY